MAKIVKESDKDTGDSRKVKHHGSGYQREYFTAKGNLRRGNETPKTRPFARNPKKP